MFWKFTRSMERGRLAIRQRAAALDAAEAARRFQQETLGQAAAEEAGGPNMGRFVEQLTGRVRPGLQPDCMHACMRACVHIHCWRASTAMI